MKPGILSSLSVLTIAALATSAHAQYTVTDLHPTGFYFSEVTGASGGTQAGSISPTPFSNDHAVLWDGTALGRVDLNPAGCDWSIAYGASGNTQVGKGNGFATGNGTHAFLWNGSAASAIDLHPVGFSYRTDLKSLPST